MQSRDKSVENFRASTMNGIMLSYTCVSEVGSGLGLGSGFGLGLGLGFGLGLGLGLG